MTQHPSYIHAKAAHGPRPVCDAQDAPLTRVTEDPHEVTCPECPVLAEIEAMPDDAASGSPDIISILREARGGAWRKVDGIVLDMSTANAILTVYEAAGETGRAKLVALPIATMAAVCWRIVGQHTA
ncbi:hypothetical protein ACQP2P_11265 [Dactylosporangium sp. CA-139114]|uniref:hypothetical protein n=1 Tax=Dactylosporangium sp. CA-139114 TaxID=3239931 RepID=UPI003D97E5CB